MDLSTNYRNFFSFFSSWGSSEACPQSDARDEEPPPEKGLWDIAVEIGNVVKWLFQAFRENFIVCYLSSHISEADRSVQVAIPRMIDKWFKADKIPFSSRMNPNALIEGLKNIEAVKEGTLAALIAAFGEELDLSMTAEDFIRQHVMALPGEATTKIPNPANGFAFWLSTQDLKQDFQTLEEGVLKDLKRGMGADTDLDIDVFVEFCRDKMGQLRAQLELLLPSEEE